VAVERIPTGREREARKHKLRALLASDARPLHPDAASPKGHLARCRSGPAGLPSRISLPARPAEIFPILLHHRGQNLLARVDAELEERSLDVRKGSQQREGNLHRRRLRLLDELEMVGFLGMLHHGGDSFVGWLPPPYHTEGEGAAALNSLNQLALGHPLLENG
jgi:hypothetical protein